MTVFRRHGATAVFTARWDGSQWVRDVTRRAIVDGAWSDPGHLRVNLMANPSFETGATDGSWF